jgi:hypothetical protein
VTIALWLLACGGGAEERPMLPAPAHASEWGALVAAAERGDVRTTRILARDLTLAPVAEDHDAAATLGAALGFLQVADDPEDLSDAVARARAACVACHTAHGLDLPLE